MTDQVRVLTAHDVEELLPMAECIELMRETLSALARGELFKSLGLAVEDLAAADRVLEKAARLGRGTVVPF